LLAGSSRVREKEAIFAYYKHFLAPNQEKINCFEKHIEKTALAIIS
jgi:hypothetical protein